MEKIKGVGDVIKVITNAMGIEQCEACKQRQIRLNELFPFYRQANPPTEEEIAFISSIEGKTELTREDVTKIYNAYNRFFGETLQPCMGCAASTKKIINRITEYKNKYNEISGKV